MAVKLQLEKTGCLIVATEIDGGEKLVQPIKNISFTVFAENISLRIGTDSDNRRYDNYAPGEFEISGVAPANAAAFITAMGVLLECSGSGGGGGGAIQGTAGVWKGQVGVDPELVVGPATLELAELFGAVVTHIIVNNIVETDVPDGLAMDNGPDFVFNNNTGGGTTGTLTRVTPDAAPVDKAWLLGEKVVVLYIIP